MFKWTGREHGRSRAEQITEAEQHKGKKWKEMRTVSETSGTILSTPTFKLEGFQKKKRKRKCMRKYWSIVKTFSNIRKEIVTQVQEAQRVLHRINTKKNMPRYILIKLTKIKHKEKRNEGKATNNIHGNSHKSNSWPFSSNSAG